MRTKNGILRHSVRRGTFGFFRTPWKCPKIEGLSFFNISFFYIRNNTPVRSEYNMLTRIYKTNKLTSYCIRKDTPERMIVYV